MRLIWEKLCAANLHARHRGDTMTLREKLNELNANDGPNIP